MKRCAPILTWVLAVGFGLGMTCAGAQAPVQIPPVHGTVLSGEKVDLPDGLKGKVGVLVIGFSQSSRDAVTAWGKRLFGEYKASDSVIYYEMPVLESVPGILRNFVLKKIGESVPPPARSRFLPVLDHEKEWKKASEFKGSDDAYVLVVDGNGVVRARVAGNATDANFAEVKRLVEAEKLRAVEVK